jgi:hypothetical protein
LRRTLPGYHWGMSGVPASTIEGLESTPQDVRGLWARRVGIALLSLALLAAALGLLGVRSTTTEDAAEGWTLRLEHAAVARAGLDVPFTVTVTREGGFGEKVTLAVTGEYFDLYETQGFNPVPSETSRDGELFYLTFDAPPQGETLVVTYDAYIQPAAQRGKDGTVSVMDEGQPVVSVDFGTSLWP